jgi:hypothetical protein
MSRSACKVRKNSAQLSALAMICLDFKRFNLTSNGRFNSQSILTIVSTVSQADSLEFILDGKIYL